MKVSLETFNVRAESLDCCKALASFMLFFNSIARPRKLLVKSKFQVLYLKILTHE